MHIPARRRPEFDEARVYEYPEHLRDSLLDMPAKPGVYIFHAAEGTLPLYIGKSINLRARLLSHMRNPDEARMLRQAARISHIRTAGEIGALLLEAQLIKQQQPLYNQKLRRNRQLCALRLREGVPEVVYSRDMNFAMEPDLYGLYGSRTSALQGLRELADMHKLCYGALGLEKLAKGRACFRAMLNHCNGVCCGRENPVDHQQRLLSALETLRVATWPYPGAIGLQERSDDMQQIHVVRNWCYLGSADTHQQARKLAKVAAGFDADGYKILCRPILTGTARIVPL
ncbi:excinuclease Cho [Comamonas jiangduensis]|uniref:excinuclease Cho n=1 Tax=Comamonas jiangduensis TaxID=1194168 RepID=UPI0028AA7415|nr:excinuclease Cho [Comamonas jiangduensis]